MLADDEGVLLELTAAALVGAVARRLSSYKSKVGGGLAAQLYSLPLEFNGSEPTDIVSMSRSRRPPPPFMTTAAAVVESGKPSRPSSDEPLSTPEVVQVDESGDICAEEDEEDSIGLEEAAAAAAAVVVEERICSRLRFEPRTGSGVGSV